MKENMLLLKDLLEPYKKENSWQIYDANIKNVYIDKLGYIVKKYNNTYHRTIEMKPVDVKSKTNINFNKEMYYEDPQIWSWQSSNSIEKYKKFFSKKQKVTFQIGPKKLLLLKTLKILWHGLI